MQLEKVKCRRAEDPRAPSATTPPAAHPSPALRVMFSCGVKSTPHPPPLLWGRRQLLERGRRAPRSLVMIPPSRKTRETGSNALVSTAETTWVHTHTHTHTHYQDLSLCVGLSTSVLSNPPECILFPTLSSEDTFKAASCMLTGKRVHDQSFHDTHTHTHTFIYLNDYLGRQQTNKKSLTFKFGKRYQF